MNSKIKIKLQGHEKFVIREGWLNKGIQQVSLNPYIFSEKSAPETFGIGSNMVKSLKYWMKAFNLTDEKTGELSILGKLIKQYDPFFENSFTLWMLHSNIAKNCNNATAWYLFFNMCNVEDLSKENLIQIVDRELKKYAYGIDYSEKSLHNDIDVIINMYSKPKVMLDPEEKNYSPFAQLELIKNNNGYYSKSQPDRRNFSEWIILYELSLRFLGLSYISIDNFFSGICGISSIYQINGVLLNEYLDRLDTMGYIRVDRTAGLDMIYKIKDLPTDGVVTEYYKTHR